MYIEKLTINFYHDTKIASDKKRDVSSIVMSLDAS